MKKRRKRSFSALGSSAETQPCLVTFQDEKRLSKVFFFIYRITSFFLHLISWTTKRKCSLSRLTSAVSGWPFFSHLYVGRGFPAALHSHCSRASMTMWASLSVWTQCRCSTSAHKPPQKTHKHKILIFMEETVKTLLQIQKKSSRYHWVLMMYYHARSYTNVLGAFLFNRQDCF